MFQEVQNDFTFNLHSVHEGLTFGCYDEFVLKQDKLATQNSRGKKK